MAHQQLDPQNPRLSTKGSPPPYSKLRVNDPYRFSVVPRDATHCGKIFVYHHADHDPHGQALYEPLHDPYGQPLHDSYGQPLHDPYGQPLHDSYGQPLHDPYGQPLHDSYGQPLHDSYGKAVQEDTHLGALRPVFIPNRLKYSFPVKRLFIGQLHPRWGGSTTSLVQLAWALDVILYREVQWIERTRQHVCVRVFVDECDEEKVLQWNKRIAVFEDGIVLLRPQGGVPPGSSLMVVERSISRNPGTW